MREVKNINKIEGGRLLVSGYNYTLTILGTEISGFIYEEFNDGMNSYEFSRNFLPQYKEVISIKKRDLKDETRNKIIIKGDFKTRLEQISKDTS